MSPLTVKRSRRRVRCVFYSGGDAFTSPLARSDGLAVPAAGGIEVVQLELDDDTVHIGAQPVQTQPALTVLARVVGYRHTAARRLDPGPGTVGPDPITDGSSPTTSEIANVLTGTLAVAANHPPLMAERCLRTVLSA